MVLDLVLLISPPSITPFPHKKHHKEDMGKASIKGKLSVIFPIKISLCLVKVDHNLIKTSNKYALLRLVGSGGWNSDGFFRDVKFQSCFWFLGRSSFLSP